MIEKNKRALRSLYLVILISIIFIVAEVVGGIYANSIAIMSDAAHLASDALGIAFSVVALKIGERSADHRYSYGYHRAEIIGAICSILFIWLVTIWLLIEATKRLFDHSKPDGLTMLWMSGVALTFNLI